MIEDPMQRSVDRFRIALDRLQHACAQPEDEFIRDAVIQRFEFVFELAWKMLKRKLEQEGIQAATPRQVIREAVTVGWLQDGNRWTELLRMRNETSHTYDARLARRVYAYVCSEGLTQFEQLAEQANNWA